MTKKRLSDLLREEVEKPSEAELEQTQQVVQAQPEAPNNATDAETLKELSMTTSENTPEKATTRKSHPTKADLESTITEMEAALQEGEEREVALKQQVADLQAELKKQKDFVQKLQEYLEQATQLKTELEQARKAATQLEEANKKLTQEVKSLQKGAIAPVKPASIQPASQPTSGQLSTEKRVIHRDTRSLNVQRTGLRDLPPHSIHKERLPGKVSDKDIGWFD